jgi:hypothetical protein
VSIPTVDQRGVARSASKFDIGAFQSILLPTAPGGSTNPTQPIVTITTPAVIRPETSGAVASSLVKKGKAAKGSSNLKLASSQAHPGAGSAAKFHKASAPKVKKHVALAKAHPAARAKAHPAAHAKKH